MRRSPAWKRSRCERIACTLASDLSAWTTLLASAAPPFSAVCSPSPSTPPVRPPPMPAFFGEGGLHVPSIVRRAQRMNSAWVAGRRVNEERRKLCCRGISCLSRLKQILYFNMYTFIVMHFNMTEGFEFLFEALFLVDRGHVKSEEARLEFDLESTYAFCMWE